MIPAGIVVTGGTAKMEGAVELAEEIFHMPVRLGIPYNVKGLESVIHNPIYATAVGLLIYGAQQQLESGSVEHNKVNRESFSMFGRLKKWVQGNF